MITQHTYIHKTLQKLKEIILIAKHGEYIRNIGISVNNQQSSYQHTKRCCKQQQSQQQQRYKQRRSRFTRRRGRRSQLPFKQKPANVARKPKFRKQFWT